MPSPNESMPSQNFRPSDIHLENTVETSSVTQWRNGFRNIWPEDEHTYMNIIRLEEEKPWLETLKESNDEFLGDIDLEDWSVIEPDAAIKLIGNKLHKSMAYSVVIVDEQIATSWAHSLVESFATSDEGAVTWYTNVEDHSWNPVSNSTFDFCAVGVDTASKSIGYLLITDED